MIIIKFREDRKYHKYGHYYIYDRKSFRENGKVKKKDKYIISIPQGCFEREEYFLRYDLSNGLSLNAPKVEIYFPEELKEEFYKAVERYKLKQEKIKQEKEKLLQERLKWLEHEGFYTELNFEMYEAGLEGKLWKDKEEFLKDELADPKKIVPLRYLQFGVRNYTQYENKINDYLFINKERVKVKELSEGYERRERIHKLNEIIDKYNRNDYL